MDNIVIGFIIGLVSSLVAGYIIHLTINWDWDPRIKVKVFPPESSEASEKYYNHLEKSLIGAKKEVYFYGEGFYTGESDRKEKAQKYIQGIKNVLIKNNKLKIYRIQALLPTDNGWIEMQNELINTFPNRYKCFGLENKPGDHIMTIILIDPYTKHNKLFLLISKKRNVGAPENINTAHTAVMIKGSKILSSALKDRLELLLSTALINKNGF